MSEYIIVKDDEDIDEVIRDYIGPNLVPVPKKEHARAMVLQFGPDGVVGNTFVGVQNRSVVAKGSDKDRYAMYGLTSVRYYGEVSSAADTSV